MIGKEILKELYCYDFLLNGRFLNGRFYLAPILIFGIVYFFLLLRTPASLTDTTSNNRKTEAVCIVTTCSSVRGDNMRTACLIAIHCCSGNSSISISYP